MTFFSIITIASDNATRLKYTGRSLAVQTDAPAFEWIVIGAAPSDIMNEFDALKPTILAPCDDPLNAGLKTAAGDYVLFLRAGDCLSDAFVLRDLRREIVSHMLPDLFYGTAREDGHIMAPRDFSAMNQGMITLFQAMLFRRRVIGDLTFDTRYFHAAPYDFALRFIDRADKISSTHRIMIDIMEEKRTAEEDEAERREGALIRTTLLRQSDITRRRIDLQRAAGQALKRRAPSLFWRLRDFFIPYQNARRPSPVQSKRRGIFFKKKN